MELSKERFSCIYKIVSAINGKVYVGSAKDYRKRQQLHIIKLSQGKHHSRILQHHYNKYGKDDLSFLVLELIEDVTLLIEKEQFYINQLLPDFNISKTAGSRLGCKATPETLERLRNAVRPPVSQEFKRKVSETLSGVPKTKEHNSKVSKSLMGHTVSDETRRKISEALRGKPLSDATKEKLRIASTGKKHTEATKMKMSAERKGKHGVGVKRSPETYKKMVETRLRNIAKQNEN